MHIRLQQKILSLLATLQQAYALPSATPDDNDALDIKLKAIFSRSNDNRRNP